MKQRSLRSAWPAVVVSLFLCLAPTAARAQVHDNAHIFGGQAVSSADTAMQQMQAKYHKQFVVETFPAIPDDLKGEFQSKGKDAFFRAWTTSQAGKLGVNGVYTLICMEPGHVQVEEGKNTEARGIVPPADRNAIESDFLTAFKAKNYDQGLTEAVAAVERTYGANIPPEPAGQARSGNPGQPSSPVTPNAPSNPPVAPSSGHGFLRFGLMGTLICLGLGLLIIFALVKAVFGNRGGNTGGGMFGGGVNRGGNYPTGGPTYGQQQGGGMMGGGPMMGGGYNAPVQQGGGGFGKGLLGGLLGGAVGGYAADKFEHRNDPAAGTTSSGGDFGGGGQSGGGGGGGFDSGPSDAGQGFGDNSSGGDFGGGGSADTGSSGGDFGGGGGDSGGGGGGDSGSSGGDF